MPPTPEQINRGLNLAESLISLATDVWQHRKSKRRLAGGVARKLAAPSKAKPAARRTKAVRTVKIGPATQ